MFGPKTKGRRREEGAVAILVALLLIVFMAAVALTVDVGGLYLRRRELVNGADSAALSAARTCARGGSDNRFSTPEQAADTGVQANAPITNTEVSGTNITFMPDCGARPQWGHVSVAYTSDQALYFAPAMGFDYHSPVASSATASWGLGSNNPVPVVVSSSLSTGVCPVPPPSEPAIGQTCAFWNDNDVLNGGNFAFLTLNPAGWDVAPDSNCSGAQSGGTSTITGWINGTIAASVSLNWTDPTYVCSDGGLRNGGSAQQAYDALRALKGQIRDFPVNWEGPGAPIDGAPAQGMILTPSGGVDKYDVIGFAAMKIVDVLTKQQAQASSTTTMQPFTSYTTTNTAITLTATLPASSSVSYTWTGHKTSGQTKNDVCSFTTSADMAAGTYPWSGFGSGGHCPGSTWILDAGQPSAISISSPVTDFGPCGTAIPHDNSAMCVVLQWQGSTVTNDYPTDRSDDITVVRLCDLAYHTCLDQ